MNPKVILLREVIVKLTPMIAGKGLRVTQIGAKAYVRPDKDGKPVQVNIPHIPDDADDVFLMAIQGFIDHEVAHVLFTEFTLAPFKEARAAELAKISKQPLRKAKKALHNLHNMVEDPFIEKMMARKFLGSAYNLERLHEMFLERVSMPAIANAKDERESFSYILVPLTRAWCGQVIFQRFMDDNRLWDHPLVKAFVDAMPAKERKRMPNLTDTRDTLKIAEIYYGILNPPPPPPPPPPPAAPPAPEPDEGEPDPKDDKSDDKSDEKQDDKSDDKSDEKQDGKGSNPEKPEDDEDKGSGGEKDEPKPEDKDDDASKGDEPDDEGSKDDGDDVEDDASADEAGDEADDEAQEGTTSKGDDAEDDGDEEDSDDDDGDGSDDSDEGSEDTTATTEGDGSEGESKEEGSFEEEAEADISDQPGDGEADDADEDEGGEADEGERVAGKGPSPFDDTEVELDNKDLAASIADLLTEIASEDFQDADYRVFTREYDKIEVVKDTSRVSGTGVKSMEDDTNHMVAPMQKDIERMMASRSQTIKVPGFRSGRLHAGSLHRLTTNDDRVFRRKQEHKSKETAVTLLIDNSGSMGQSYGRRSSTKVELAMKAGFALSQTLERVGIVHEVIGFTTLPSSRGWRSPKDPEQEAEEARLGKGFSRNDALYMPIYKTFGERLTPEVKRRFVMGFNGGVCLQENIDGECVRIAGSRLSMRREVRKVMLVLSDGCPSGSSDYPHEITDDLHRAVKDVKNMKIDLVGIGILDSSVKRYYPKSVVLKELADLPGAVMRELKTILTAA